MRQILALAALGSVARHQDVRLRHHLAHHLADLRIGRAHYRAHIAVVLAHALRAPLGHLFSHILIQRPLQYQPILKFPAGRIGGLYKDKDTLLFLLADLDEGIDPVGAQVGIDRGKIFVKGDVFFASHPDFAQMPDGIRRRGGTDVPPLDIADDHQIL